jgi:hypothetical protein
VFLTVPMDRADVIAAADEIERLAAALSITQANSDDISAHLGVMTKIATDLRATLAARQAPTEAEMERIIGCWTKLDLDVVKAYGDARVLAARQVGAPDASIAQGAGSVDSLGEELKAAPFQLSPHMAYAIARHISARLARTAAPSEDMRKLLDDHDSANPQPRHCPKCGLPLIVNPHPDAGRPDAMLEVGVQMECLPCTVKSRHEWSGRALVAEKELRELAPAPSEGQAIPTDLSSAATDVLAERQRQKDVEGWTPEHDDEHATGAMARAAAAYAIVGSSDGRNITDDGSTPSVIERIWPWDWSWFKPKDRRRNLVKAGALILAEIERLDRAATKGPL